MSEEPSRFVRKLYLGLKTKSASERLRTESRFVMEHREHTPAGADSADAPHVLSTAESYRVPMPTRLMVWIAFIGFTALGVFAPLLWAGEKDIWIGSICFLGFGLIGLYSVVACSVE